MDPRTKLLLEFVHETRDKQKKAWERGDVHDAGFLSLILNLIIPLAQEMQKLDGEPENE